MRILEGMIAGSESNVRDVKGQRVENADVEGWFALVLTYGTYLPR